MRSGESVVRLERRARAQLGLFTTSHAHAYGVTGRVLSYHSRPGGRWGRLHPGVYELAGLPPSRTRRLLAALLWDGDDAVLSHRTAGKLADLDGIAGRVVTEAGVYIGRLDLCWPEAGLWAELDGRRFHEQPKALLSDRRRQNEVAGYMQWLPLRFAWDDIIDRPAMTIQVTEDAYRRRVPTTAAG